VAGKSRNVPNKPMMRDDAMMDAVIPAERNKERRLNTLQHRNIDLIQRHQTLTANNGKAQNRLIVTDGSLHFNSI
jgi:hypothetical protein